MNYEMPQKELQKYCDNLKEQCVLYEHALKKAVKFYQETYEEKYVLLSRGFVYKEAVGFSAFDKYAFDDVNKFAGNSITQPSIGVMMPTLDEHIYAIMYDEDIDHLRVCLDDKVFTKNYEFNKNDWEIVRDIFDYVKNPQDLVDCMNEAIWERTIKITGHLAIKDDE